MNKMNRSPEISVVMPVYNGEKFLKEAMGSILNQTYKDFEFLIVYDESTDGTLSIIQEFQEQDARVVLINGDKEGISGALNKGIKEAKGKYIARMDADDISLPIRFETQISHMQNLELDICGGHSLLIDSDGKVNGIGIMPRSHDLCGLSMMFMVPFVHSSVIMLKSFLTNSSLKYQGKYEDFDMWIRMFSAGAKFGNVDDVVAKYRVLDESLSTIHAVGSRMAVRGFIKTFRREHHQYLSGVIKHININLLSEKEKSLVVRYLVNRIFTRLDFFGLRKLKGVPLQNIVITIFSEVKRLLTKSIWRDIIKLQKKTSFIMKILHSFILFSNEVGSGTTDFMYKICKAQAKVGLKPTILSGSYAFDQVLADTLDDVDFHVEKTWFYKQGFSLMPRLISWCRKNLKQYDVVHMHVYRTFQNIVLYYYCRKYKIPYVIDAHGSVLYFIKKIFIKKMFDKFIGKSILKNASFLLAESKKGIEEYKIIVPDLLDSKLRIIYPSFDLDEFKSLPDQGRFRKSQGLSSEINIVMFVGRLNPIKGLEFLIRSFSKFASNSPNSKLYIVGEDDGTGYGASLVDIIKEYQLEDSVVFSGFLTGYDKLSAVMDASVLVQCSRLEQGPRVPFEAVLLGTPVIVTKHTGSGEIVTQFDAGQVVEYNNTEQLSQSLQSVIGNLEHARNRTNKAAKKIKKNMSLEKVVIQYQELYVAAKKSVL